MPRLPDVDRGTGRDVIGGVVDERAAVHDGERPNVTCRVTGFFHAEVVGRGDVLHAVGLKLKRLLFGEAEKGLCSFVHSFFLLKVDG